MSGKMTYEEVLVSGKPLLHFTVGDSMEPLLYNRDTQVLIERVSDDTQLKAGELPLYRRSTGQYVMHRIIKADSDCYYTRGDNRCGLERIPKKWVIGVVTEIYRKDKHIHVADSGYRMYVTVWNLIYPLRWLIYRLRRMIHKIKC